MLLDEKDVGHKTGAAAMNRTARVPSASVCLVPEQNCGEDNGQRLVCVPVALGE